MEEELSEHEIEERLYARLHHVDETQKNDDASSQDVISRLMNNAPRTTVRRYWRTCDDNITHNKNNDIEATSTDTIIPIKPAEKEVVCTTPPISNSMDLTIMHSRSPVNVKTSIEIPQNYDIVPVVELVSSDEDEVIEVVMPPKPTITIESSDEETMSPLDKHLPNKESIKQNNRDITASPVASIVSSVSDDFIHSDCIALKISSKSHNTHNFDFSLHGSDLLETPSKNHKKQKSKVTSTPIKVVEKNVQKSKDVCFVTPKSTSKGKALKSISDNSKSNKSIQNLDIDDSDSNQSVDISQSRSYVVTDKSIPSIDVYESDSSHSSPDIDVTKSIVESEKSIKTVNNNKSIIDTPKTRKRKYPLIDNANPVFDLTNKDECNTLNESRIDENIVIGNVEFLKTPDNRENESTSQTDVSKLGSTKIPPILNEDLDFDHLKGNETAQRRRKYSFTTIQAEMEKFYNESWGGENFNHKEIQKTMSRDKNLWAIDPKDRMPTPFKRKVICNYCNRPGHRDDSCRMKPPVCHMCGETGHYEPRCPKKICVNCGSRNFQYSTMCRNCSFWGQTKCQECGQMGHPNTHCPDLWRRYHNTIDDNTPLHENRFTKKPHQLFCSGCARRGHLVHNCRLSIPFSGLPINSPYVAVYRPVYSPDNSNIVQHTNSQVNPNNSMPTTSFRNYGNNLQSKSPSTETHSYKKRSHSASDDYDENRKSKSHINLQSQLNSSFHEDLTHDNKSTNETNIPLINNKVTDPNTEKAPDCIVLNAANHDKNGRVIQDNAVSESSEVVASSRIYITNEAMDKLQTEQGKSWLAENENKYNVVVEFTGNNSYLSLKGKIADQESFQTGFREWVHGNKETENEADISHFDEHGPSFRTNIPKNRFNALRTIKKAFASLDQFFGEPKSLYKHLTHLKNLQSKLLQQKNVSPKKLTHNRNCINKVVTKLNTILLGQAGFAGGSMHLNQLNGLLEKLNQSPQKIISPELREEIGEHYHCIFTPIMRDDYTELLEKYYTEKRPLPMLKRTKENAQLSNSVLESINTLNYLPTPNKFKAMQYNNHSTDLRGYKIAGPIQQPLVKNTIKTLNLYRKRLIKYHPMDSVLKRTKSLLVKNLYRHIAALEKQQNMSSKSFKKIKKTQEQVQLFLKDV